MAVVRKVPLVLSRACLGKLSFPHRKLKKNESRFSFLAGVNSTNVGRKSLLSSFQLGWLRPEYKFWAHKELHNALSDGKMKPELTVHSYIQFRRLALPEGVGVVCLSRACLGKSSRFIA
jgi:hypothetical protein